MFSRICVIPILGFDASIALYSAPGRLLATVEGGNTRTPVGSVDVAKGTVLVDPRGIVRPARRLALVALAEALDHASIEHINGAPALHEDGRTKLSALAPTALPLARAVRERLAGL